MAEGFAPCSLAAAVARCPAMVSCQDASWADMTGACWGDGGMSVGLFMGLVGFVGALIKNPCPGNEAGGRPFQFLGCYVRF